MQNTVLSFPTDLGAGHFALAQSPRHSYSRTQVSDLSIIGSTATPAFGTAPYQMSGIGVSANWVLCRVRVQGFYAGVDIQDDHQTFRDCSSQGNFYNYYWSNGTTDFGDQYFDGGFASSAYMANFAVGVNSTMDGVRIVKTSMGLAPYVLYRESGTTTKAFITNCQIDCSAEEFGNALIYGVNAGDMIASNRFNGFNGNRSAAFAVPGAAYSADLYAPSATVWFNDFLGPIHALRSPGRSGCGYRMRGVPVQHDHPRLRAGDGVRRRESSGDQGGHGAVQYVHHGTGRGRVSDCGERGGGGKRRVQDR